MTLAQYQSATFWTDGSNYFATIPLTGASTTSVGQTGGSINGTAFPTSAGVIGSNASAQPIAASAHGVAGPLTCTDSSGSSTTYTCSTTPTFTPAAKDCVYLTVGTTNTAGSTLNVNSAGAANLQKWLGSALVSGDLPANKPQVVCYDGTNWQVSTIGNTPSSTGGMTKLCSGTASSSATLQFDASHNCGGADPFSTTYKYYLMKCDNLLPSGTTVALDMRVATTSGSYDSSSIYNSSVEQCTNTNFCSVFGANSQAQAVVLSNQSNSTGSFALTMNIYNPSSTTTHKMFDIHGPGFANDGNWWIDDGAQRYKSNTAILDIELFYSSGNLSTGTCDIWGLP